MMLANEVTGTVIVARRMKPTRRLETPITLSIKMMMLEAAPANYRG
jgi:hypothetical protein